MVVLLSKKTIQIIIATCDLLSLIPLILFILHLRSNLRSSGILDTTARLGSRGVASDIRSRSWFRRIRCSIGSVGRFCSGMLLALLRARCFLKGVGKALFSKLMASSNETLLILFLCRQDGNNIILSV